MSTLSISKSPISTNSLTASEQASQLEREFIKEWKETVYFPFIIENYKQPLNWYWISINANVTFDTILQNVLFPNHGEVPWNWKAISMNPNVTMDIVNQNPFRPWDLEAINRNPSIVMNKVMMNTPQMLDSRHRKLTSKMIQQASNTPWGLTEICSNPNLTMSLIREFPEKAWDWDRLSLHAFELDRISYVTHKMQERLIN